MEQRSVSYGELIELDVMFDEQAKNVDFPDEEIKEQARMDFIYQYINGCDDPKLLIAW